MISDSIPQTLSMAQLTVGGMIVITSIIYWWEKNKRLRNALEFWIATGAYFVATALTIKWTSWYLALPTVLWLWRLRVIRNILEDVGQAKLQRSWHPWVLGISFLLAAFFGIQGRPFIFYSFPQSFTVFIVACDYLWQSHTQFKLKGKTSIHHKLLLIIILMMSFHTVNYTFFRDTQLASFGFTVVLLIQILMAITLQSVTMYELRQEQEQRLEKLVEERSAQLVSQAKLSVLGEMAVGIGHEINNPLGIIIGRASHLKRLVNADRANKELLVKNLGQIEDTTERISRILRGLKEYSRDSKDEKPHVFELNALMEETIIFCHERFEKSGVKLILTEIPDVRIKCRNVQLTQVFLNLLNNSLEAIEDLPEKWVRIDFIDKPSFLEIRIIDSGTGIAEEIREKIFQPFFSTKGSRKGTGLGLSISRTIIEDHKGRFHLDGMAVNTTFVIEIPKIIST